MKVVALGDVGLRETAKGCCEVPSLADYAEDIVKVEGADAHCLVLLSSGQVIVWGKSANGRLGIEGELPAVVDRPMLMDIDSVVDIACAGEHSLALLASGAVLSWGRNNNGQLGLGCLRDQHTPQSIPALPQVKGIACGSRHSAFLDERGHVFVCGRGLEGQLGCGSNVKFHTCPHILKSLSCYEVASVSAGSNMTLFMMANGSVWVCGDNTSGALGLGDKRRRMLPEQVRSPWQEVEAAQHISEKTPPRYGTAESYIYSRLHKPLRPVEPTAAFTKSSVGWGHVVLLDASGRVFACGSNSRGECGQGLSRQAVHRDLCEVAVEPPRDEGCAAQAALQFHVGDLVAHGDHRGRVIGLARGRVGVRLELPSGATRDVGALPCTLTVLERAAPEPPSASRVFVDDVIAGRSFSAALSGGLLYVWGKLPLPGSSVEQPRLPDGRAVPLHAEAMLGGARPTLVPASRFAESDCDISVKAAFSVGHALLAVVDAPSDGGAPQGDDAAAPCSSDEGA